MSKKYTNIRNSAVLKKITDFLSRIVTLELFIILSLVIFGFALAVLPLTLYETITPSTSFGESIEGVVLPWYWLGIAIMIVAISYMLTRLDVKKFRILFLISCVMLIIPMRSVLTILSPLPYVEDTWREIHTIMSWQKYGIFSREGLAIFSGGYPKDWPISFILAYLITYAGTPIYTFYLWAPTIIHILDLVVIYFLFKELANEKVGMVSAFLFTLLNTAAFFPLHYSPQTLGALFYLVVMYTIVKAYKTRKQKHLALALLGIFGLILTHHMSTFFLGISLAGAYLSKYFLEFQQKIRKKNSWFSYTVNVKTFIKFSLPLCVFTFALWYFYGFIVYRRDAIWMLTEIMRLLTTQQPRYETGYYGRYLQLSPLSQLSILVFPAFVLGTAAIFIPYKMLKEKSVEGYLWFLMGWTGAVVLAFIFGNLLYGNYIEPLRSQEIMTLALYPASALFLLRIIESKSLYKKGLITIVLITVALFSVLSTYRGAQNIVFFEPPWWMRLINPP